MAIDTVFQQYLDAQDLENKCEVASKQSNLQGFPEKWTMQHGKQKKERQG